MPVNPLAGLRMGKLSREERQRAKARAGRALSDDEICAVWHACEELNAFGALVRMALLTGMRRGELAELRWADVVDDAIVIPEERAKNGREHRVPLTELMCTISPPRIARGEADWCLPAPILVGRLAAGRSVCRAWSRLQACTSPCMTAAAVAAR